MAWIKLFVFLIYISAPTSTHSAVFSYDLSLYSTNAATSKTASVTYAATPAVVADDRSTGDTTTQQLTELEDSTEDTTLRYDDYPITTSIRSDEAVNNSGNVAQIQENDTISYLESNKIVERSTTAAVERQSDVTEVVPARHTIESTSQLPEANTVTHSDVTDTISLETIESASPTSEVITARHSDVTYTQLPSTGTYHLSDMLTNVSDVTATPPTPTVEPCPIGCRCSGGPSTRRRHRYYNMLTQYRTRKLVYGYRPSGYGSKPNRLLRNQQYGGRQMTCVGLKDIPDYVPKGMCQYYELVCLVFYI